MTTSKQSWLYPVDVLILALCIGRLSAQTVCNHVGVASPDLFNINNFNPSSSDPNNGIEQIRYNYGEESNDRAWCPDLKDASPTLDIIFPRNISFGGIIIQRPSVVPPLFYPTRFMKSFDMFVFTSDGFSHRIPNLEAIANKTVLETTISFLEPIVLQRIQIIPKESEIQACFRLELIECIKKETTTSTQPTTTTTVTTTTTTTTTTQKSTLPPIPNYNWSFLNFTQESIVSNGYNLSVAGRPNSSAEGIHLQYEYQFISISNIAGTCLTDPTLCEKEGFTFNLAIKVTVLIEGGIIFTSGGDKPDQPGITLIYRFGLVHIVVSTTHQSWYLSVKPELMNWKDKFANIYISWSSNLNLQLIVNQILVAEAVTPLPHTISSTTIDSLIIGGNSVQCIIANIQIWLVHILELINSNIVSCQCNFGSTTTTSSAPTTLLTSTTTARPTTTFYPSTTDQCGPGCVPEGWCSTMEEPTEVVITEGPEDTTQTPATEAPTSTTKAPTTEAPPLSTEAPPLSTEAPPPSTEAPTTEAPPPSTEAPTTEAPPPSSEAPTTEAPPSTESPTTEAPPASTEAPTTEAPPPSTEVPTTAAPPPSTEAPTTEAPPSSTEAPTTEAPPPSTEVPTTEAHTPSSEAPITEAPPPSTEAPTTEAPPPSTEAPTTEAPPSSTEAPPSTEAPTTEAPVPSTEAPTTEAPPSSTEAPTTEAPPPTTEAPTTEAPAPSTAPTTEAPTEEPLPSTESPTTEAPTTEAPTTEAPTTEAPTTEAPPPSTEAPTTEAPTTEAPTTEAPTPSTEAPTTEAPPPSTEAPTTEAPLSTEDPLPSTESPTTEAPTTEAPPPSTEAPTTTTLAPTTTTTSTARPPTTTPCPEFAFSVSLTTTVNTNGQGQLSCSLSTAPPSGVSILFYWYVNGVRVNVNKTVEAPEQSASILASETGIDLLNNRITCSAEVKYTSSAEWCNYQTSNIVRPAVTCPPSSPIKVTEGAGHYLLHLNVSVPPALLCKPQDSSQCRVEVVTQILGNNQDLKCTQTQSIPQVVLGVGAIGEGNNKQCGVVITNTNWLLGVTIPVKATIDGINDGDRRRTLKISVRIVGLVSSQIQEVYCNDIDITAGNMDKPNTCSSVNDPHITTYDKRRYNNMLSGEFILHRHKTLPFEVSVLYRQCSNNNPRVTCNCGAAVRSGDDVITFKTCDARQNLPQYGGGNSVINVEVFKNGVFTKGTKIRRFGTGQKYEVTLPIGTKVTIVSSRKPFMDISVTGSAEDRSKTEGLCGDFNEQASNDFNGSTEAAFNLKWRRPSTMFNGVAASGNSSRDVYCSCIAGQTANCDEGLDVFTCTTTQTNPADVTDSLVQQAKLPIIGQTQTRSRRTPRQANIDDNRIKNYTEAEAYDICSAGLDDSSTVKNCQEQFANASVNVTDSITSCVEDLMETGDIAWIAPHIRDLTEKCLTIARQDEKAWDGNSTDGEPSLPAALVTSLCSPDCGTNGTCINGICVCHSGYSGESCQFSKDTVPLVLPAADLCDVIASSCAYVLIDGLYFHQSSSLTCHIKYVSVTDILALTSEEESVPANYISFSQISCPVQRNAFITVSNDNIKSSNSSHLHIITKSSCQSCELSANGTSATCQWKPFSCIIDGQCYARNEVHPTDNCFKCNPDISTDKWTALAEPYCQATMQPIINRSGSTDNTAVIVLGVITGILFLMVAAVVVYIIRKKSLRNKSLRLMGDDDTSIDFTRARTIQTASHVIPENPKEDRMAAVYNPTFN